MGVAAYRFYLIPLSAGNFTLPEIAIPYFDPERGVMDVAQLDSQTLAVAPALRTTISSPQVTGLPISAREVTSKSDTPSSSWIWPLLSVLALTLWLATLALWWYSRHRSKEVTPRKIPTTTPGGQYPLQTALLEAFGSRTLEEGLNKWERQHGQDPEVRDAVRTVQKYYYGKDKAIEADEIRNAVKTAIKKINAASTTTTHDPWSPRSFTPGLTFLGEKR
jgi:hypothetical protein